MANMKRTQIYLPEAIHRRLKAEARRRKCTMADLVRKSVERELENGSTPKSGAAGLLKMIEHAEELAKKYPPEPDAPTDLAENIDYYLYGEGRIE